MPSHPDTPSRDSAHPEGNSLRAPILNLTGEYALRAMLELARGGGESRTAADLAAAANVPKGYLSKILHLLVRGGLIHSRRGIHGGFVLSRPASQVSVMDVLVAVDGRPGTLEQCPLNGERCEGECGLHAPLAEGVRLIEEAFRTTTLKSICRDALPHHPPAAEGA